MAELTEKEIKAIVKQTVIELKRSGLLKRSDDVAYSEMSERLFEYFRKPGRDKELEAALDKVRGDYYFGIIQLYYQKKYTIDWIAEAYHCEVSTITRNKRRLCLRLSCILS